VPLVYTDHDSGNPMRRARAPELFTGGYDRGYYGGMVMEAARTVFRGMGVGVNLNPNAGADAEPVQGTLERWLC